MNAFLFEYASKLGTSKNYVKENVFIKIDNMLNDQKLSKNVYLITNQATFIFPHRPLPYRKHS